MALGDPRAVAHIADATDTADTVAVRIAIDAAATLGGDDARTFLEFLRDHPSEDIGEQAAAALIKLGENVADARRQ
jgi:HEAT repeat protein